MSCVSKVIKLNYDASHSVQKISKVNVVQAAAATTETAKQTKTIN